MVEILSISVYNSFEIWNLDWLKEKKESGGVGVWVLGVWVGGGGTIFGDPADIVNLWTKAKSKRLSYFMHGLKQDNWWIDA